MLAFLAMIHIIYFSPGKSVILRKKLWPSSNDEARKSLGAICPISLCRKKDNII